MTLQPQTESSTRSATRVGPTRIARSSFVRRSRRLRMPSKVGQKRRSSATSSTVAPAVFRPRPSRTAPRSPFWLRGQLSSQPAPSPQSERFLLEGSTRVNMGSEFPCNMQGDDSEQAEERRTQGCQLVLDLEPVVHYMHVDEVMADPPAWQCQARAATASSRTCVSVPIRCTRCPPGGSCTSARRASSRQDHSGNRDFESLGTHSGYAEGAEKPTATSVLGIDRMKAPPAFGEVTISSRRTPRSCSAAGAIF